MQLLIENVHNIKHKCIIMVLYSAGLRLSEIINLKLKDIDSSDNIIHIFYSRGKKRPQSDAISKFAN